MVTFMLSVMLSEGTKSILWFWRDGKQYVINLNVPISFCYQNYSHLHVLITFINLLILISCIQIADNNLSAIYVYI